MVTIIKNNSDLGYKTKQKTEEENIKTVKLKLTDRITKGKKMQIEQSEKKKKKDKIAQSSGMNYKMRPNYMLPVGDSASNTNIDRLKVNG